MAWKTAKARGAGAGAAKKIQFAIKHASQPLCETVNFLNAKKRFLSTLKATIYNKNL